LKAGGVTVLSITKTTGGHMLTAPATDAEKIRTVSSRVFGVASYGQCECCPRDLDVLKTRVCEHMSALLPISSFKVECSRIDKRYELTSPALCNDLGTTICDQLGIAVSVRDPAVTLYVDVHDTEFVYYTEKSEGALGLPVKTSGSVACLVSGGFDSPVAAWMMMRRGCRIVYVHFHSAPYGEWRSSVGKLRKIVEQLSLYGGRTRFYAVPIGESQRLIATKAPEKLRVMLYRRLMMRVAKRIAETRGCSALATGDSLGQVASQTIESMMTIQSVVEPMLILRPLLTFCKEEILARARAIGTHDLSIFPGGDCCSHMLPKNCLHEAED
jgi:thiamine biosynthesis protein ThiI